MFQQENLEKEIFDIDMIYKIIEDKKWEYKCVEIDEYDLSHNQLDSICEGYDGWEMVTMIPTKNKYTIILKRSYIEKTMEDNYAIME